MSNLTHNHAARAHHLPTYHLIAAQVAAALAEDIGSGDISAQLIAAETTMHARLITREAGILCGTAWFDETLRQIDEHIEVHWQASDGDAVEPEQTLCELRGPARGVLTAERTAMNFLQTLSGTATAAHRYSQMLAGTNTRLLDTRKTLPGLRLAQKYATRCGGADNHRLGLYDQFLIKENHIHAAGSIRQAVENARQLQAQTFLEVEVENLEQLAEACAAGADRAMLDNFPLALLKEAMDNYGEQIELEASGNVTIGDLRMVAATGVHYVSIGAITKHVRALDLSLRYQEVES